MNLEKLERRNLLSAGDLDSSFGVGGIRTETFANPPAVNDCIVLANDKILLVGRERNADDDAPQHTQVRLYNADGTLDTNFGIIESFFDDSDNNSSITRIIEAPDGKLVASGQNGSNAVLARFDASGLLDTTFSDDGFLNVPFEAISAFDVAADGSIVATSEEILTSDQTEYEIHIVRYTADGSLDPTFSDDGATTYTVSESFRSLGAVKIQPDNKIILGGNAEAPGVGIQISGFALARLNANGSVDTSFGNGGLVFTAVPTAGNAHLVQRIALLPNGNIVAAGETNTDGGNFRCGVLAVRYKPNGTLDPTFNGGAYAAYGEPIEVRDLKFDSAGNAVIIGAGSSEDLAAARITPSGTVDPSFGRIVVQPAATTLNVAGGGIQSSGNIIVAARETIRHKDESVTENIAIYRFLGSDAAPSPITLNSTTHAMSTVGTSGNDIIQAIEGDETAKMIRNGFGRLFNVDDVQTFAMSGGAGNDLLAVASDDFISSTIAADITGGDGKDRITGGSKNDTLRGDGGRDFIDGGSGADLIIGGGGNDQIRGQGGADHIYGGAGNDVIFGNSGNDRIDAGPGVDTLFGNAGDDLLLSLDDAIDQLFGNSGHDSTIANTDDVLVSVESS